MWSLRTKLLRDSEDWCGSQGCDRRIAPHPKIPNLRFCLPNSGEFQQLSCQLWFDLGSAQDFSLSDSTWPECAPPQEHAIDRSAAVAVDRASNSYSRLSPSSSRSAGPVSEGTTVSFARHSRPRRCQTLGKAVSSLCNGVCTSIALPAFTGCARRRRG